MENIERVKLQFRAVGGLPLPSSIFEIDETPKTRDERLSGRAVSSLMKLGEFGGVCPDGLHELLAAEKFVLTAARLENRLSVVEMKPRELLVFEFKRNGKPADATSQKFLHLLLSHRWAQCMIFNAMREGRSDKRIWFFSQRVLNESQNGLRILENTAASAFGLTLKKAKNKPKEILTRA